MKRLLPLLVLLGVVGWFVSHAQGPDEQYIQIYGQIQQADQLLQSGQTRAAFELYQETQRTLKSFQLSHPNWNDKIVQYRLEYLASKLAVFEPSPAPAAPGAPPTSPAAPAAPAAELIEKGTPLPADTVQRLQLLSDQVRQLTLEKGNLEAKLREALAAQPAPIDARELARAEQRILFLQKENELLKVSLKQVESRAAQTSDPAALAQAQRDLTEANRKLAEQTQAIAALTQEKALLEARVRATPAATAPAGTPSANELALLQSENEYLKKEITDLRQKTRGLTPAPIVAAPAVAATRVTRPENAELDQLRRERDELQRKLAAANQALSKKPSKKGSTEWQQLTSQLASLQARLDVLEARKVPYTAEELALLKSAGPTLAVAPSTNAPTATAKKRTMADLPPGAGALMAEAQRAFNAGRFDVAEEKYKQILKQDENNVYTLGNLAAIQLKQSKMAEAEATLKKALTIDPQDPFNLSMSGYVLFLQDKLDPAFETLSQAASLDPKDSTTQNRLGIVLLEKGQREAAETAFRKAIQLAPNNAEAHSNLAFAYATQKPPFAALARYHYQKAITLGQPRNPELERTIETAKASP